jgi:SUZ domain
MKRVAVAKSVVEDDAKSESSASLVLTHEERQAVYEKTRARIFSDYVESQKGAGGEKSVGATGGSSDEAGSESTPPHHANR